ncbi:MAG: OmpA family protein [Bacteroidales bacterium]|nr:OmpA family protein [Bacteroidales bacterium]
MKKIICVAFASLLLLGGTAASAQSKNKKENKKKTSSPYVEGRQKVREYDYGTFDKYTSFSTKDNTIYYCPFDYTKLHKIATGEANEWGDMQPVINYLQTITRASMTICALYAVNPEITDPATRKALAERGRQEADAAMCAFNDWKAKMGMKNKTQYAIAEIDYRYFKGTNYYNEQRSEEVIPAGVLLYFGSRKKKMFVADTTVQKFPDIRFFPNDATIVESWNTTLDEVAEYLKNNDRKGVMLVGYSDNQGTEAYIEGISRQRATEVKKALLARGVEATRVEIEVKGDADPVGDNSTYEGRIANNRVAIIVQ